MPLGRKKRGRKKKFKIPLNIRAETVRSTVAVVLILFAGLILVSFVVGGTSSNAKLQQLLRAGFGFSHLLLVPILLIGGLLLLNIMRGKFVELRVLIALFLLLISVSGLSHIRHRGEDALELAKNGVGGGLVGHQVLSLLEQLISVYGAFLVLVGLMVIAILLMLDKSADELLGFFKAKLAFLGNIRRTKQKSSADDIQITPGLAVGDADLNLPPDSSQQPVISEEPSFEVIPTMAEPQSLATTIPLETAQNGFSVSPNLPYSDKVWELPPLDLLDNPHGLQADRGDVKQRAAIIEDTLSSFGITAKVKDVKFGPSVTQYALESAAGTKVAKISGLQYDLALALASPTGSVRIEAPIPGRSLIGIEVPNNNRVTVNFKEVFTSEQMKNSKSKLTIILGLDVGGQPIVYDIAKMPHLLIAGATGSGKSVFIHSLMFSLLYQNSPQECKFILIDPKRVELSHYADIPHLQAPVITDSDKAQSAFKWAVEEMKRRYKLLESARVRNIDEYNKKSGFQALSNIIIVVDELAEIMIRDQAGVEKSIISLAQLARATGIHLILALQRPTTNVITGLIKANIPCRVAFNVTNNVDSRVIIDQQGAEKLMGAGDMLFVPPDTSRPTRIQGAWVSDAEIGKLITYLKSTGVQPEFHDEVFNMPDDTRSISSGGDGTDPLYGEAMDIVITERKASASLLQRRLSIGYSRAARILDELEARGVIGPPQGSKPRDIMVESPAIDRPPEEYVS